VAQAGFAFGEASGPDYSKSLGSPQMNVLNIREKPSASADKIGEMPADGTGIRNLGCGGGLTWFYVDLQRAAAVRVIRDKRADAYVSANPKRRR